MFVDQEKTANDAKSFCETKYARLFEPRSTHTNDLVFHKGNDVLNGDRMWIGVVSQNGKLGPWKFAASGDDVIQPMWIYQPNNNENEIWAYLGYSMIPIRSGWSDDDPSQTYRFICEYNILDVSDIKVSTYIVFYISNILLV